jgi:hypothetical protein
MKHKPIYEYTDKRMSVQYALEQKKRKENRLKANKILTKNYFTNPREVKNEIS